jgi:putative membrane protein
MQCDREKIEVPKLMTRERTVALLLLSTIGLLAITGIGPYDRGTWLMEVAPVLIAVPVLGFTYRRFPLTTFLYALIALHAVVLMCGGAYTYARVPLGFWLQDMLSLSRNPYDRIGHFMQGLVPALVARELLIRGGYLTNRRMAAFLCLCVAMAISAWYELIEWGAASILGQGADEFLGTQGDPWDTQWDMFMCFLGALTALLALARVHDRQMEMLHSLKAPLEVEAPAILRKETVSSRSR